MTEENTGNRISFNMQGHKFLRSNSTDSEFNYAENRPRVSTKMSGKIVTLLNLELEMKIIHIFDDSMVEWEILSGPGQSDTSKVSYGAFELAPEIFFTSFLARSTESVGVSADFNTGAATIVKGNKNDQGIDSVTISALIEEAADTDNP